MCLWAHGSVDCGRTHVRSSCGENKIPQVQKSCLLPDPCRGYLCRGATVRWEWRMLWGLLVSFLPCEGCRRGWDPLGPLGTAVLGVGGHQPVVGQGRRKRPRRISGRGHDVREPPGGRRGGGFRLLQPLVRKPAGQQGRSPASSRQRWELSLRAL